MQCAKGVGKQTERGFSVFVGLSSPHPGMRMHAHALLHVLNNKQPGLKWYILDDELDGKAQFEHIRDLLQLSDAIDEEAWLMFLDNDDMFHPKRVQVFWQDTMKGSRRDPNRIVFTCGNKLLLDRDIIGYNKLEWDEIVTDGGAKEPWREDKDILLVTTEAIRYEVQKLDATEYFDYCCKASVLQRFLELAPAQLLLRVVPAKGGNVW
jgi:hypothetical protein